MDIQNCMAMHSEMINKNFQLVFSSSRAQQKSLDELDDLWMLSLKKGTDKIMRNSPVRIRMGRGQSMLQEKPQRVDWQRR